MSPAAEALFTTLDGDSDVAGLERDTDYAMSIGRDVWRLIWRGEVTTAVTADADLHTTCGALLDAIAVLEESIDGNSSGSPPRRVVNVLVHRPLPDATPSETDDALRTLRNGVVGVTAHIWYRRDDDWVEDLDAAPVWTDDKEVAQWVDRLMLPRLTTTPSGIALELLDAVTDPSLHLYPSEIRKGSPPVWALRIDGLEIGTASQDIVNLSVGKPSKTGVDRRQRADFIEVFGAANVAVSHEGSAPPALLDVQAAAARIRLLLLRFRAVDVPGAPVAHRSRNGVRFIDEHALEARLLKGLTTIEGATLIRDDDQVARGSQFQTKWGRTGRPRYLDAMLRRGTTPLAVELKVATGGQGRYYRRSVLQAVLYRHFILNTPALDPWFEAVGLPRLSIEAAVGIPYPQEWSVSFDRSFTGLRRVAARFGVEVHLVDDRATPEWTMHPPGPDPDDDSTELHSWRLAAAISRRWPRTLSTVNERHDAGGFYDQIELTSTAAPAGSAESVRPRLVFNRPGSAWIFTQLGTPRWTWRDIWRHLAAGGDTDDAAKTLGAIAGLPAEKPSTSNVFAEIAVEFLATAPDPGWRWRCAWACGMGEAPWAQRELATLGQYIAHANDSTEPVIARFWAATRDGAPFLIIDQRTLRTWMSHDNGWKELDNPDPLTRAREAATNITTTKSEPQ